MPARQHGGFARLIEADRAGLDVDLKTDALRRCLARLRGSLRTTRQLVVRLLLVPLTSIKVGEEVGKVGELVDSLVDRHARGHHAPGPPPPTTVNNAGQIARAEDRRSSSATAATAAATATRWRESNLGRRCGGDGRACNGTPDGTPDGGTGSTRRWVAARRAAAVAVTDVTGVHAVQSPPTTALVESTRVGVVHIVVLLQVGLRGVYDWQGFHHRVF
mmetsp:Transcript_17575/g.36799  ORF Transcript_17575/g.36799 Transcript_17575/m.36799 type:complete len:218 (+) Transcript_17575:834-1487(+)